jgi:hypothetical protein
VLDFGVLHGFFLFFCFFCFYSFHISCDLVRIVRAEMAFFKVVLQNNNNHNKHFIFLKDMITLIFHLLLICLPNGPDSESALEGGQINRFPAFKANCHWSVGKK